MNHLEVWDDGVVHVLPEEGRAAIAVEGDAVGDFDEVELFFFGQDLFNVGFEEGVGFEDFGADRALDGGFDFGFGAGGESVGESVW